MVPPSEPGTPPNSPMGRNTPLTNLTGHPCVVVPNGFIEDGTPSTMTFVESCTPRQKFWRWPSATQDATDFHLRHPNLD